jgi:hypothetical protein
MTLGLLDGDEVVVVNSEPCEVIQMVMPSEYGNITSLRG